MLAVHRFADSRAYRAFMEREGAKGLEVEADLERRHPEGAFDVPGICWVCGKAVAFRADYQYGFADGSRRRPNWRERLQCPGCGLINRQRATMQLVGETLGLAPSSRIYLTEQVSAFYAALESRHAAIIGSEYLGPGHAPGSLSASGVRHEDLTALSLADGSVDAVLTFDVLEHVPRYREALAECHRVLAPGGVLLLSAPFLESSEATRMRAEVSAQGEIVHHHPAQYHGDPVNPEGGVLCFQEFGWDLLDTMRAAGFEDVAALAYRSPELGYLGGWPLVFTARKAVAGPASARI